MLLVAAAAAAATDASHKKTFFLKRKCDRNCQGDEGHHPLEVTTFSLLSLNTYIVPPKFSWHKTVCTVRTENCSILMPAAIKGRKKVSSMQKSDNPSLTVEPIGIRREHFL